jgi:hypothetical protein
MQCPKCKAVNIKPIQENKEDYWLCKCGCYHKGFPYKCIRDIEYADGFEKGVSFVVNRTGDKK